MVPKHLEAKGYWSEEDVNSLNNYQIDMLISHNKKILEDISLSNEELDNKKSDEINSRNFFVNAIEHRLMILSKEKENRICR